MLGSNDFLLSTTTLSSNSNYGGSSILYNNPTSLCTTNVSSASGGSASTSNLDYFSAVYHQTANRSEQQQNQHQFWSPPDSNSFEYSLYSQGQSTIFIKSLPPFYIDLLIDPILEYDPFNGRILD